MPISTGHLLTRWSVSGIKWGSVEERGGRRGRAPRHAQLLTRPERQGVAAREVPRGVRRRPLAHLGPGPLPVLLPQGRVGAAEQRGRRLRPLRQGRPRLLPIVLLLGRRSEARRTGTRDDPAAAPGGGRVKKAVVVLGVRERMESGIARSTSGTGMRTRPRTRTGNRTAWSGFGPTDGERVGRFVTDTRGGAQAEAVAQQALKQRSGSAQALKQRSGSANGQALKRRSGSANGQALKHRSGSANGQALKQRSGSANGKALKQRSGSANGQALKQRSGSANGRVVERGPVSRRALGDRHRDRVARVTPDERGVLLDDAAPFHGRCQVGVVPVGGHEVDHFGRHAVG